MKFKIHHPKLLAAVLLTIMGLTSAAVLWAEGQDNRGSEPAVFPAIPINAELTEEQGQEAVAIVEESGVVKTINGNQDWGASGIYRTKIGGKEAIRLDATWETPVTSSGPWQDADCQGTRKIVTSNQFSNVTKLTLHVYVEEKEVVAYAVGAPDEDASGAVSEPLDDDMKVEIYDFKTGDLVHAGRLADLDVKCPDGMYDD